MTGPGDGAAHAGAEHASATHTHAADADADETRADATHTDGTHPDATHTDGTHTDGTRADTTHADPTRAEAADGASPAHVVVVGAGVAGLVAAYDLARAGVAVTLLESSERPGGRVSRHTIAGLALDAGAESFATRGGTVAALLAELGLADAIVSPNPTGAWLQPAGGPARPLPKTGLLGIPANPLARDVIAVLGPLGALRAGLDAALPRRFAADEEMLGPLVRRRMGRRALEQLVAPVASGIHSRHPDSLPADRVAPGLRAALARTGSLSRAVAGMRAAMPAGSAVSGIDGGMFRLVQALVQRLDALGAGPRTGCPAVRVDPAGRRVTLANGSEIEADATVLAAPVRLEGDRVTTAETRRSIVLATLVVDSAALDVAPRGTGVLMEQNQAPGGTDAVHAKALTHATAKWPWLAEGAGPHRHAIRLSYNDAPAAGFEALATSDAERLLGVPLAGSVIGFARTVWPVIQPGATAHPAAGDANRLKAVGESVAGTGLAAVIGHARRHVADLLEELGR